MTKLYKVTGLNSRNRCEYANIFETREEAELWYNKVMQRKSIRFILLRDLTNETVIKAQGC